jgi:cytidine deaminase
LKKAQKNVKILLAMNNINLEPRTANGLDIGYEFLSLLPFAIENARRMRANANHYSGKMKVGAVALALDEALSMTIVSGANQNLSPGQNPSRICAEDSIIRQVSAKDIPKILGFVVSGPQQRDTHSDVVGHTLHCCGTCRTLFDIAPFVQDDTLLITVDPEMPVYDVHTVREKLDLHDTRAISDGSRTVFDPGFIFASDALERYETRRGDQLPAMEAVRQTLLSQTYPQL